MLPVARHSLDADGALVWRNGEQYNGWAAKVADTLEDIIGSELAAWAPESYGDLDGVETRIPTIVLNEDFAGWRD